MKSRIFATLSSLALLTAATAFAQSDGPMRVAIPFEFRVGKTILPAGPYDVRVQFTSVVVLRSSEGKAGMRILTHGVGGGWDIPKKSRLEFHRYGNTYFLARVWSRGTSQGRELRKSMAERELARNISPVAPVAFALAAK